MIKKFMSCIREYKIFTILTPLYVTLEVIMEVIIPIYMASLIDKGIDKGNMNYVIKTGLILVVLCIFSLIFGALAGNFAARASAGFAKNLRHDMYYNVQGFSFSNIDKFSTASIVTRLTTDVTNVQNAFQMLTRIAVRSPIMLVFSMIMAFRIHERLSLIFLGILPILGIGLFLIMTNAYPIFQRVFKTYDKLNNVVQENLRGIRVVKSFVREDFEVKKFKNVSSDIYKDFLLAEKLLAFASPLMQFSIYGCILGIAWFGARIIVTTGGSELTTGQLMSLITYAIQMLMSLMMLSVVVVMLTIAKASAERDYELLMEESDIKDKPSPIKKVKDGSIEFKNVSFKYSSDAKKNVLSNINISIKSGQTVGIVGGTGSSKTSLVQLIPRLYDVTEGEVLVGGVNVADYEIKTLRDNVAMVLQKNELFSGTIKENLRWGNLKATDNELIRACKLAQADGFIRELEAGYDTYIEQGGTNVSGGQKQRLCIARALLKNPKILILDDSTSAVDTKTDTLIRDAFKTQIPNITKIIIAQRISSIMDSDLIIVLDDGKVSALGSHDELLKTSEIYKEVYTSQMKGGEEDE